MAMSVNSIAILNYLKENPDANVTSADLVDVLGLTKRQIDGCFTSALQRKGYGERVEAEVEGEDGKTVTVKFLKLTPEGRAFDPDAEAAE